MHQPLTRSDQPGRHRAARSVDDETHTFLYRAVQDLSNPIAVIRASARMAERQLSRGDAEAVRRRLQAIIEQTDRLHETLEAFLEAESVATGRLPLRSERLDLREVVQAALDGARRTVGERAGRRVEIDVAEGCVGSWDRARVVRAIRMLLENAFTYGDPSAPVRVWAERGPGRVRLRVSGGGPGPTHDELSRLFERFFRGRSAAEAGQAGRGLGLYSARGIARAHGGEVRLAPSPTEADVFEIELPIAE